MGSEQKTVAIREAMQLALAHHQAGRLAEAERIYRRVLQDDPINPGVLHLLGVIAHQGGKNEIAVQLIDRALTIKPDYAEALNNRGAVLRELKRYEEALASYDQALTIKLDYAEALSNRGNVLHDLTRYEEALASYDQALAIKPNYADALSNRGNVLHDLKRCEEALASYDKALAVKPDYTEALCHRGAALHDLKRYDEALDSYDKAQTIKPEYADAHWNESLCRLLIGDFERGWEKYEWRWKSGSLSAKREFLRPLWLGKEDITGKTILLHAEQGLGDTLQFCRYAPLVSALGAKVLIEVPSSLKSLLATLKGVSQIVAIGESLPEFDFHCPLMSLPLVFKTNLESIPADIPYLHPEKVAVRAWEERLSGFDGLRIGLVWAGSPRKEQRNANVLDRLRSIPLAAFESFGTIEGMRFYSIQMGPPEKELSELKAQGWSGPEVMDFTCELDDFSDTAAFTACMDLVISCDTSMVHLAGAIGKPVWILSRFNGCWRWLVDRDDSPWYPTARIFRQSGIGDWHNVIGKVQQRLRSFPGDRHFRACVLSADR
ncbi:MAG: glycosyltransferase family protein [Betaproteobacteria bacterium]|nr:glycosyltransferase family protein [Betaproteobacteria bacterium]